MMTIMIILMKIIMSTRMMINIMKIGSEIWTRLRRIIETTNVAMKTRLVNKSYCLSCAIEEMNNSVSLPPPFSRQDIGECFINAVYFLRISQSKES